MAALPAPINAAAVCPHFIEVRSSFLHSAPCRATVRFLRINQLLPVVRARSHGACLVGRRVVVVGGTDGRAKLAGVDVLGLDTGEWTQPACSGTPPQPRYGPKGEKNDGVG